MQPTKENTVGYIVLKSGYNGQDLLVKANKILAIGIHPDGGSFIWSSTEQPYWVRETIIEIMEQLENIHPSLL